MAHAITREIFQSGLLLDRSFEKKAKPFFEFMNKRHAIWVARFRKKQPWPWTKDPILRDYFFTNVFRELDRVTIEMRRRMRGTKELAPEDQLFHIILFRAFNLPETYDKMMTQTDTGEKFKWEHARKMLHAEAKKGNKVFTGAYIVTNAGSKKSKIDLMLDAMIEAHRNRKKLWNEMLEVPTMEHATTVLTQMPMQGWFTAYEVVCDMRHEGLIKFTDTETWANPGPGARRGINYMLSGKNKPHVFRSDQSYIDVMRFLLLAARKKLDKKIFKGAPKLEMREIEMSLCEWSKYMNAKTGQRKMKRRYRGPA